MTSLVVTDPGVRRHLALRVAVRLAQRLIFLVQVVTVIAVALLLLLDVWQITESPVATWHRITDTGFDAGPIRITVGRILLGVLVVYLAVLVSWLLRNVAQAEVYERWNFDRGVGESINKLLHYLLVIIAIVVALAVLGVELRNFAIVAGALGIGIGFGLQNVVSNFVTGLILLFESGPSEWATPSVCRRRRAAAPARPRLRHRSRRRLGPDARIRPDRA